MSNYRTKIAKGIFALFALALALSVTVTQTANHFKNRAAHKVSELFSYDLQIKTIFYIFPNNILLTDVTLTPKDKTNRPGHIQLSRVLVQFSLSDILFKRQFSARTIIFDRGSMPYDLAINFLHSNANAILALIPELPKTDARVLLKEIKIHFVPPEAKPYYSTVDFEFALTNNRFLSHGAIYNSIDLLPIRINLKGILTNNGIRLSQCSLRHLYAQANIWAELRSGQLQLNGYAFLNKRQPFERKNILTKFTKPAIPSAQPPGGSIDIVDLDLKGKFAFPKFEIEHLNFAVNNSPVQIKGNLSYVSSLGLDLSILYSNAPSGTNRINNFKDLTLLLKGDIAHGEYQGTGKLNIAFERSADSSFSLQSVTADSEELQIYHDRFRRLAVQLLKGDVTLHSVPEKNIIAFDDLSLFFNWRAERFKIIDVVSEMYTGHLQGRVWIDVLQVPARVTAMALLKEFDANQMAPLVKHFAKIHGELNGKLNIQSHPKFNLTGDLTVTNGKLENFDFFTWMAGTFGMPSLIRVPFTDLSTQYSLNAQGNGISDIHLSSPTVGLTGYFNVDKSKLVSSKVSLSLGRTILQESPKFRAILKMFDEDVASLPFDFQLSGNQDAMNFQWLQTEFKERIQKRIPNFIERMIDRRIDAILEGKIGEEPAAPAPPASPQ